MLHSTVTTKGQEPWQSKLHLMFGGWPAELSRQQGCFICVCTPEIYVEHAFSHGKRAQVENKHQPVRWVFAALFIIAVASLGGFIGFLASPDEWYQALEKPVFNPPAWVFGPVWTLIYVLIGAAGWRSIFVKRDTLLARLWGLQMVLNYIWSPIFFGLKAPGLALGTILALLGTIAFYTAAAWTRDKPASVMFLPYLLWVVFASVLNAAIVLLN